jgi:hypothetical protein
MSNIILWNGKLYFFLKLIGNVQKDQRILKIMFGKYQRIVIIVDLITYFIIFNVIQDKWNQIYPDLQVPNYSFIPKIG